MNYWLAVSFLFIPPLCEGFEVGYTASMVNWPFVAGLYYKEGQFDNRRPFCTGTIILDKFVLTTIGCLNRKNPETPSKKLYEDILAISAWVGSSFGFVPAAENVEAQMVGMKAYYFPGDIDLKKTFGLDAPAENKYTVEDYDYYYLDFSLLETIKTIKYNNYVHAVPFDVLNLVKAKDAWNKSLVEYIESQVPIPDCYTAGWGSFFYGNEAWRLNRLRYVKARFTEKIHCKIAYCGNCSLCYRRLFNDTVYACYGMYMTGDTCLEDEGAPLFCPWFGPHNDEGQGWGALLGHMTGRMGNCRKTELPSMFSLIWNAYPFISRVTRISWPPPAHEWIIPRSKDADDYDQESQ